MDINTHLPIIGLSFIVPLQFEGSGNIFQVIRVLEMQSNPLEDKVLIITPRDQSTVDFLRERRQLTDRRKVSIITLNGEGKKVKILFSCHI